MSRCGSFERTTLAEREGLIQRLVLYGIIETAFLPRKAIKQHEQFAAKRERTKELSNLMMSSSPILQDNKAHRFPVSVKGIVYHDGRVVLLKNERDEWELPGGKLELGETPETCVVREIEEEQGYKKSIQTWIGSLSRSQTQ